MKVCRAEMEWKRWDICEQHDPHDIYLKCVINEESKRIVFWIQLPSVDCSLIIIAYYFGNNHNFWTTFMIQFKINGRRETGGAD